MGKRGSSSGFASGGNGLGYDVATSVKSQEGTEIDLTNTPLRYGAPDPAVSGATRQGVEAQERKRLQAKIEFALGFDASGRPTPLGERKGGRSGVRTSGAYWPQDGVFTHNHPRTGSSAGLLGGTFSIGTGRRDGDISSFIANPVRTIRASAAEGTYSMTKGPGFDGRGLLAYAQRVDRSARLAYRAKVEAAAQRLRSGEITYAQYQGETDRAFNETLVSLHNGLLAGQEQYGYTYTLERRRS